MVKSKSSIRPAEKTDCVNLAALSIQVWLHTYAATGIRSAISTFVLNHFTPEYFERIYTAPCRHILVAEHEGLLIGYVGVDLQSLCEAGKEYGHEVTTLYVQEHSHGQGVGRRLLQAAAKTFGSSSWLKTWIHNTPAPAFYQHMGYAKVGETYFAFEGERHKNIILAKTGPSSNGRQ